MRRLAAGAVAAGILLGCGSGARTAPPGQPAPTPASPAMPGAEPTRPEPGREVTVRYPKSGAGMLRYAFARRDSVAATMPSGEAQVQLLACTAYLTISWIAADSGTKITGTVDSLVADSGQVLPFAVIDSARGTRWTALRPPGGGLTGLTATRTSLLGDQIRDQLMLLFPHLPAEGARSGSHWEDSTDAPSRVSAFEASQSFHFASDAAAAEAGGVLPMQVVVSRSATGEATQFGQPITLKATGSDTLAYRLGSDGRVLEAGGRRWTSLVVELSSIGQTVPVSEVSSIRMTLLR